jgi:hypothetical protein
VHAVGDVGDRHTAPWPIPALVDRVLVRYVEWRETTGTVADTYGRFCAAQRCDVAPRFAAYMAALDQEQTAAGTYAESISELERRLRDLDLAR